MSTTHRRYDAHDAARILEEALTQIRQHATQQHCVDREVLAGELIDSLLNIPELLVSGEIGTDYAQQCLDAAVRNLLAPQWHSKPVSRVTFLRRPVALMG